MAFTSGMVREPQGARARHDLLWPLGVPYEHQMMTRVANHYALGAVKYSERNWEQADSEEERQRMMSAAARHFHQWLCGESGEDHAAALVFNIIGAETVRYKLEKGAP